MFSIKNKCNLIIECLKINIISIKVSWLALYLKESHFFLCVLDKRIDLWMDMWDWVQSDVDLLKSIDSDSSRSALVLFFSGWLACRICKLHDCFFMILWSNLKSRFVSTNSRERTIRWDQVTDSLPKYNLSIGSQKYLDKHSIFQKVSY